MNAVLISLCFFFQAEDGIRDLVRSRGLGDVYKRQVGNEGDFEDLAEARTSDFRGRRLIYKCSTPTILGLSLIHI